MNPAGDGARAASTAATTIGTPQAGRDDALPGDAAIMAVRNARRVFPALASCAIASVIGAGLGGGVMTTSALAQSGHGSPEAFRGLYEKRAPELSAKVRQKNGARTPERGRFGRLFPLGTPFRDGKNRRRTLKAHQASVDALRALGASGSAMHSKSDADNRNSLIPAGYTFLGQFVDHDVTFDTVSALDKRIADSESENARTATLDLDSVYGGGPERTPFLYNLPYLLTGEEIARGRYDLLRRTQVARSAAPYGRQSADAPKKVAQAQPAPTKVSAPKTEPAEAAPTPASQSASTQSAVNDVLGGSAGDINNILGIDSGGGQSAPRQQPKPVEKAPKSPEPPKTETPKAGGPKAPPAYARGRVTRDVALIGDPRNDENVVISQMQAAFIAFHNRMVDLLLEKDGVNLADLDTAVENAPTLIARRQAEETRHKVHDDIFKRARQHAIHYYQRMLAEDFLPRIIGVERIRTIRAEGRQFYFPRGFRTGPGGRLTDPFIPVEFSVAAYRYGHAQVRNSYTLSGGTKAVPLFGAGQGPDGIDMMGFKPITRPLMIDWRYYFPFDGAAELVQMGRPINTSLPDALFKLVEGGIVPPGAVPSLASRNLNRGLVYNLPSGQALARVMKIPTRDIVAADIETRRILNSRETPLWYYVLQEAKQQGAVAVGSAAHSPLKATSLAKSSLVYAAAAQTDTAQAAVVKTATGSSGGDILGPVGGTIVGEVLLGLLDHYRQATGEGLDFRSEIDAVMSKTPDGRGGTRYEMRDLLRDAGVAGPVN
ncbi:MAG: peroxidase family protein [Pseudomonadota bacterium]